MSGIGPGTPGATMEAFAEGFACGQVGILFITIDDGDGNNIVGPTTANIIEIECTVDNFGVYRYEGIYPADPSLSPYVITWEGPSGSDPTIDTTATEEIYVDTAVAVPPSDYGPCSDWITGDDVAACCSLEVSSGSVFDSVAASAQNILFELSGRKYAGLCGPITVRPCRDNCTCFPYQRVAYASGGSRLLWTGAYWGYNGSQHCGCGCLSQVKLSGYPVQQIMEVKIDGEIVSPEDYRLDEHQLLTRKNGIFWPSCQDLSLDDTEEGTFSVSYLYGAEPPPLAVSAASELACELYKGCPDGGGDCVLPQGVTRQVRQGITIEKKAFTTWGFREGRWNTGLALVDAFLNSANPAGIMRRPTFWAPGRRYARPVG
jgi:hypothetical protein